MKKNQLGFATADQVESVYYEAFTHGDADVMSAIWSKQQASCIHPGSGLIEAYEAVTRSWRHILSPGTEMEMDYRVLSKTEDEEMVVHVVEEKIHMVDQQTVIVVATNIYKKCTLGWQIILHHGSVVQSPVPAQQLN